MSTVEQKPILELIRSAKRILLVTHSRPGIDAICSMSALYAILQKKYNKDVDIYYASTIQGRVQNIFNEVGVTNETLLKDLKQNYYVISIKKQGEKIESINFNEEGDTFNFVITPFNGKLDLNTVAINETGSNYDLIITVDSPSLNFLGDIYKNHKELFEKNPIISFDNHKSNAGYATHAITFDDIDTTAQTVSRFFLPLMKTLDQNIANLLFAAMYAQTNILNKSKIRGSLFEDMASLVAKGANAQKVTELLYAPFSINEIFLVGDILDSSNEGEASKLENAKVIGCKINLNKEELQTVDMDKTAEVVFWNIKTKEYKLAYILFQRSAQETVGYIYAYDDAMNLTSYIKALNGLGTKSSGKMQFNVDMNSAENMIKEQIGMEVSQKTNQPTSSSAAMIPEDDFDDFEDFGDTFSQPSIASAPYVPPQLIPSSSQPVEATNNADEEKKNEPSKFDPRLGK